MLIVYFLCFKVVGHKKGLDVMERADPLFLLMGLPTIPVMLVLGKMIRWEDYVVRLWQRHSSKLQIFNGLVPGMWKKKVIIVSDCVVARQCKQIFLVCRLQAPNLNMWKCK